MAECREMYELPPPGYAGKEDTWRRGTHTCGLPAGHELPHACPLCGSSWRERGGSVTPVDVPELDGSTP